MSPGSRGSAAILPRWIRGCRGNGEPLPPHEFLLVDRVLGAPEGTLLEVSLSVRWEERLVLVEEENWLEFRDRLSAVFKNSVV